MKIRFVYVIVQRFQSNQNWGKRSAIAFKRPAQGLLSTLTKLEVGKSDTRFCFGKVIGSVSDRISLTKSGNHAFQRASHI
jgi:hypothetical protein